MKIIPLRHKTKSAQTCVAMIAGVSVKAASKAMDESGVATPTSIQRGLNAFGYKCDPRKIIYRNGRLPNFCLVFLSTPNSQYGLWVIHHHGLFYDPTAAAPSDKIKSGTIKSYIKIDAIGLRDHPHLGPGPRKSKFDTYRNGGDGFIKWAEEHICIQIYPSGSEIPQWTSLSDLPDTPDPDTGRSYKSMWEEQKKIVRKALVMVNGRFKHRLVVLCWPRGEGKTYVVCMIQMWKFFCWPKQEIMLCANSKDQTKFVQYHIIRQMIENSPKLLAIVGKRNIQEKEIKITDKNGNVVSFIRSISNFSGIVSNITGYAFSEIFEMKKPEFFQQIDGSIRNMPNALGVMDSTVSPKDHILFKLYEAWQNGEDETIFFSYRFSKLGLSTDFWHPQQTQQQLNSYKTKFVPGRLRAVFPESLVSRCGKGF